MLIFTAVTYKQHNIMLFHFFLVIYIELHNVLRYHHI